MKTNNSHILALILISITLFCCKKDIKPGNNYKKTRTVFPLNGGSYWKASYHAPSGGPNDIAFAYDSIFVSNDTIGLKVISYNPLDTNWITYNVLKVHSIVKRFGSLNWETLPITNFGIFRLDTINNKVITVHTDCYCWPGGPGVYPTNFFFNERVIFDYNLQTNDTAYIKTVWYYYNTHVTVDSFLFNGYYVKKQSFKDDITNAIVSTRSQFACIYNMTDYHYVALPNSSLVHNAYKDKLVFYANANDSLELDVDTGIYP